MNESVAIVLPHGFSADGAHSRDAALRELTEAEQLFLAEECQALCSAAWTTEALALCVTRLGPVSAPDRESIRALTVGDRDALLLHLHTLCFGRVLRCQARCPSEGCGETLELSPAVQELLLPAYPDCAQVHEFVLADTCASRIRFRLPTGADHEAAAEIARADVASAITAMVKRCLLSIEGPVAPESLEDLLSARMAELDPQAELLLHANCPGCGHEMRARLDMASFLRQRLAERVEVLHHEVHQLAFHYHWSPRDILQLGTRNRQRYLRLLQAELARSLQ